MPNCLGLKRCSHHFNGPVVRHDCAGDDQDVTFWLLIMLDAADGYPVMLNAEGQGRDQGQAQPGGHKSLCGPVFVCFDGSTRDEAGALVCLVGCGAAATYFTFDVDPCFVFGVGE